MPTVVASETYAHDPRHSFRTLFETEDHHFWFRARNKVLEAVFQGVVSSLPAGYRVLEVGCGTGNVLRILEQTCTHGQVMGVDLHPEGLQYARQRVHCPLFAGDIHEMSFPELFDVIGLFDVLEHLPDDRTILDKLSANLKPGGKLLLTVPAHQALWSYADDYSGHYRRYAPRQLQTVLEECGFRIEYLTQFMMLLYPAMWLGRRWNSRKRTDTVEDRQQRTERELHICPWTNAMFYRLLSWEAKWIRLGWRLPLGTSLLAVAEKCPA